MRHRERSARSISFGDCDYTDDPDDQRALAAAISEAAQDMDLSVALTPTDLAEIEPAELWKRSKARTGRAGRATAVNESVARSIGLAGEVIVGEWLRQRTGLTPEQTWRSGYRSDVLGDSEGSDSYGYDFAVPLIGGRSLLLEVKASSGELDEFQLKETRFIAPRASDRTRSTWWSRFLTS